VKLLEQEQEQEMFSKATWVNLHFVLRRSEDKKRSIRARRLVWHTGETRTRYSLDALENEFGICRPPRLRSHSNSYADRKPGEMHVLELARKMRSGDATAEAP
jgi:hypothetical protein